MTISHCKITTLLTLFLLSACGQSSDPVDYIKKSPDSREFDFETSDAVFDPYRSKFEAEHLSETSSEIFIDHIRINFVQEIQECESCVGACISWGENREIHILEDFWVTASEARREMLIFHELGHCALSRGHKDDTVNSEPISVMNSFIFSPVLYITYVVAYINELMTEDETQIRTELE